MSHSSNSRVPVLIAGGGPVGLTLAALLSHHGIRSLVIEADAGYCTGSRAICISRRSLEIFGWIGGDKRLLEIGLPWVGGRSYFQDAEVLRFEMTNTPGERFAPMINVQQYEIEEVAHRSIVTGLGEVRWSSKVTEVADDGERVRVRIAGPDGIESTVDADWLVACDGGRSTVRSRLGLQLEGIEYDGRYVIVDIEQETSREVERLAWFDPPSNPGSTILMHRQPGNVWRVDYQLRDDEDPIEAIEPENVLPRVQSHLTMIGETAPWKALWISIYNAKCLTLARYRHGRVLFAGDAAHLVPIFGVRGLNSGLDDVGNLAWRLARVIAGNAAQASLDDYSDERVHAARENMAYGAKSTEFMAPPNAGFRLMREAALRLALDDPAVRSLINPRQSTPVAYPVAKPVGATGTGDGPLIGRPAPDARIDAGPVTHLTQLFGRRFVLLSFGPSASHEARSDIDVIRILASGDAEGTTVIDRHGEARARYVAQDGHAILVRPDGYVVAQWSRADDETLRAGLSRVLDVQGEPLAG